MKSLAFTFLILLSSYLPAFAQNLSEFKRVLIADQGRVKPIDSFSKTLLLKISGQSKDHNEWLYQSLFNTEEANKKDLFLIENPELKEALSLDTKKKRFSFNEIETASKKLFELSRQIAQKSSKDDESIFDQQVINLRENFYAFINITNTFLFSFKNPAFALSKELKDALGLESSENSLYDILQKSDLLSTKIAQINTQSSNISDLEKQFLELSLAVYAWVENFRNFDDIFISDTRFSIIPSKENQWLSPWQVIYQPNKETKSFLWQLSQIQKTHANPSSFNQNLKSFNEKVRAQTGISKLIIEAEILYNTLNPFKFALIFYLLAIGSLAFFSFQQNSSKASELIPLGSTIIAFGLNTIGLILRIIIMQRAPVSNLYETFIFIAWAIAVIGLIIYFLEKNKIGILISSICGFALLLISFKFAAEGDTMKALIAVLNSNFWLSTHVIAITLGYAGVFAAGIMGHVFIIQKLLKVDDENLKKTKAYLLGILGFGLVMSFLGTLLGGIWADQSWGRFWGWDPKENGALLIVLWTALIFHARLSGFIKDIGLAQASVIGCIVVMLSWLGVNLLGVGLHSYGFTNGLFYGLLAYALVEIVFVIITSIVLRNR